MIGDGNHFIERMFYTIFYPFPRLAKTLPEHKPTLSAKVGKLFFRRAAIRPKGFRWTFAAIQSAHRKRQAASASQLRHWFTVASTVIKVELIGAGAFAFLSGLLRRERGVDATPFQNCSLDNCA